jgi:methionine sulfoxide reductase heme-binding subunit
MGHALWYTSRATGLVSLVLFTVVVVLGAANVARFATAGWPRFVISTVHRNLSLLALTFIAVHVATSIIDPYAGIGWLDAVIPFQSVYKPFWLGLGAAAGDLLVAIIVTSLLRLRIGLRWWRLVHWASYACWPLAVIHGLGTGGSDSTAGWVIVLNVACVTAVGLAVAWRLLADHADTRVRSGERIGP